MPEYLVAWSINIMADSPEDAARHALEFQRDPESTAVVFDVRDVDSEEVVTIDLMK